MMTKSQTLVIAFVGWVLVVLALLVLFQSLSAEYFFVLCLIGFLIIIELSGPFMTKPRWRSRVNIIIAIGVVIFAVIVFNKIMEIIG